MKKKTLLISLAIAVIVAVVLVRLIAKDATPADSQPATDKAMEEKSIATEPRENPDTKNTSAEDASPDGDMIKLELEYPKPLFAGTPKSIKTPNLERKAIVPEIMIPIGTENIAKGKDVTGSDDFPVIGELEYITDADKDGADGSYVELGPGVQWVQIDLGEKKTIYAVALWHYHAQARAYRDVIIQVADDADFIENVQTVFNNDHDNSASKGIGKDKEYIETNKGKLVDVKGAKGQFIRLYSAGSTGSDMNHYIEVEVFGK